MLQQKKFKNSWFSSLSKWKLSWNIKFSVKMKRISDNWANENDSSSCLLELHEMPLALHCSFLNALAETKISKAKISTLSN